jgi:hypothetical protein
MDVFLSAGGGDQGCTHLGAVGRSANRAPPTPGNTRSTPRLRSRRPWNEAASEGIDGRNQERQSFDKCDKLYS